MGPPKVPILMRAPSFPVAPELSADAGEAGAGRGSARSAAFRAVWGGGCWSPTGCQPPPRLPAGPGVFAPCFEGVKTACKRVDRIHPGSSRAPPGDGRLCALPWEASSAPALRLRLTTVAAQ